jgi:ABC-type transport system involved in multi-copper enzyme maturation permease subunit
MTHYGFRQVARMEWIKLRSLRSTWATLGIALVAAIGIAIGVGAKSKNGSADITNNVLGGTALGLLLIGVLGVLTMSNEYTSGMIRSTFAAAPNRGRVLAAKAAVFGIVALVVGELASFAAFFVGTAMMKHGITAPGLGDSGVFRAVVLDGTGYCLVGLLGMGLGAIIRHTAAALGVLVGVVYVLATVISGLSHSLMAYTPVSIVANCLSTVQRLDGAPSPWVGLGVLCAYAVVALGIGRGVLAWRDA